MSLRWSSYVDSKPPKGPKTQNGRFPYKIAIRLKKVCYKVSLYKNCQRQSCKAFIGLTIRAKMNGGCDPFYLKFGSNWPRWSEIVDFRFRFACSDSVVIPSKKSSINTNRKCTTRFPMSTRWTSYVVPKPPKGAQKRKESKIWTICCDNSETVRDKMPVTINHYEVA